MKIDLQKLAEKIRTSAFYRQGQRSVVFSEDSAHAIHDELIRLYKLENAILRRSEVEAEISELAGTPFPQDDPRMQDLNDDSPQDESDV